MQQYEGISERALWVAGGGGIVLNMKMREKVINILGGIGKIGQYVKIMAFFAP